MSAEMLWVDCVRRFGEWHVSEWHWCFCMKRTGRAPDGLGLFLTIDFAMKAIRTSVVRERQLRNRSHSGHSRLNRSRLVPERSRGPVHNMAAGSRPVHSSVSCGRRTIPQTGRSVVCSTVAGSMVAGSKLGPVHNKRQVPGNRPVPVHSRPVDSRRTSPCRTDRPLPTAEPRQTQYLPELSGRTDVTSLISIKIDFRQACPRWATRISC